MGSHTHWWEIPPTTIARYWYMGVFLQKSRLSSFSLLFSCFFKLQKCLCYALSGPIPGTTGDLLFPFQLIFQRITMGRRRVWSWLHNSVRRCVDPFLTFLSSWVKAPSWAGKKESSEAVTGNTELGKDTSVRVPLSFPPRVSSGFFLVYFGLLGLLGQEWMTSSPKLGRLFSAENVWCQLFACEKYEFAYFCTKDTPGL